MENMVVERSSLSEFFRDKKVFISGHTGFKGAWLTVLLKQLGALIKGYALAPENENDVYNVIWNDNIGESVIADIRDKERLKEEINIFQPDFIFHLAAQPLVRESYKKPAETFEVNVVGTANLLEGVINLKKKCTVVVITTDKVYRNKEVDILYAEDDILGGYDPYSASKACTELVVNSFRDSFFNVGQYTSHQKAIVTARAGNVIGGGDWNQDRLLPDIVRALESGIEIKIRNPNSIRPWQHVLEPLTGY
jgi:CDP-glucose 4,6-dehydratase